MKQKLKWITNDFKIYIDEYTSRGFVIGEPETTDTTTLQELKGYGLVGIYKVVDKPEIHEVNNDRH